MAAFFDYESVGRQAGLTSQQVTALEVRWREDYPNDPSLLELRMLRTCLAIQRGDCTFEEALQREPAPVHR